MGSSIEDAAETFKRSAGVELIRRVACSHRIKLQRRCAEDEQDEQDKQDREGPNGRRALGRA